jgi:hypothetical protein
VSVEVMDGLSIKRDRMEVHIHNSVSLAIETEQDRQALQDLFLITLGADSVEQDLFEDLQKVPLGGHLTIPGEFVAPLSRCVERYVADWYSKGPTLQVRISRSTLQKFADVFSGNQQTRAL